MTNAAIEILKVLFNTALSLLTSFNIPGTNFTPLGLLIFFSFTILVVKFVKYFFGFDDSASEM